MSRFVYLVGERDEREALRLLLGARADLHLVPFASGHAFLDTLADREPGCVLLDTAPGDGGGLDLLEQLSDHGNLWPIVVVTGDGSVGAAVSAMKLGAVDYLEKPLVPDRVLAALDAGQRRVDRLSATARGPDGALRRFSRLSTREREVIAALLDGCSNKQIAHRLSIGLRTVEVHRANVMAKLDVTSVAGLVRVALLAGEPLPPRSLR